MKGGENMEIEIRSADEVVISGYVNAVERDSRIMPKGKGATAVRSFVERVKAGVFRNAIASAKKPIELRMNHDKVLCDTSSGLTLYEDSIGLHASAVVHDPEVVEDARSCGAGPLALSPRGKAGINREKSTAAPLRKSTLRK